MKRITAFQFNVVFVHSNYNFRRIFAFLSFSASMRNSQNKTSAPGGLQNHAVQFIADCRLKSAYMLYRQLP